MNIFAISDLHLSLAKPEKDMAVFGPIWKNYIQKMETAWDAIVKNDDLVLIAGDISWAMRLEEAMPDLIWIDQRPGIKVLIRGNHDYWWTSKKKLVDNMPPSLHVIEKDVFNYQGISIAGTRLWDDPALSFTDYIDYQPKPESKEPKLPPEENERYFLREIERLKLSLSRLDNNATLKIAMLHYPPVSATLSPSITSQLLESHEISHVVFGHLHNLKQNVNLFGAARGITYHLTAADYLNFKPKNILI